jgi:hypothetical protein
MVAPARPPELRWQPLDGQKMSVLNKNNVILMERQRLKDLGRQDAVAAPEILRCAQDDGISAVLF